MRDPEGRTALFSLAAPPHESALSGEEIAFEEAEGREALFSVAGRRPGTVRLHCEQCSRESRVDYVAFVKMHLPIHLWFPWRRYSHWLICPACGKRSWMRVDWFG